MNKFEECLFLEVGEGVPLVGPQVKNAPQILLLNQSSFSPSQFHQKLLLVHAEQPEHHFRHLNLLLLRGELVSLFEPVELELLEFGGEWPLEGVGKGKVGGRVLNPPY